MESRYHPSKTLDANLTFGNVGSLPMIRSGASLWADRVGPPTTTVKIRRLNQRLKVSTAVDDLAHRSCMLLFFEDLGGALR